MSVFCGTVDINTSNTIITTYLCVCAYACVCIASV